MKHLKLIASILAMCLLMAGLPAVTAEDLPESEDEIVFSVPFEDVVEEDAEQDIVYGEEVGEEEQTTIEEIELPAEETEVETPEETNRYYASVGEDGAKIYAGATGKEVLGKAYEGNVFLVVGTSGKRAMVAFCIEDAVYEGYIAREKLVELDQEALDNYHQNERSQQ